MKLAALGGAALVLCTSAGRLLAQAGAPGGFGGGGFNFDPAQMQQMVQDVIKQMSDAQRQQLEVTNDEEWTVIAAQIQKVTDARAQLTAATGMGGLGGLAGLFGAGRRGGAGGGAFGGFGGPPGGAMPDIPGMGSIPGMPSAQPVPEADALQRAVDENAGNDALKASVARLVEVRKQRQAALDKAQGDLRKLLSVRQEAIAYIMGLL